jgi:GNAT superfamily N-acetyltransferase
LIEDESCLAFSIGSNPRFVTVVAARKVDLYGRIGLYIGKGNVAAGPAEVMDFLNGAELSDGGRSIFALTSRDPAGSPNILLSIADLPNQFNAIESVGAVVTEYGIAFLEGRTLRERAQALIDIAHPDEEGMRHLFYRFSDETVYARYFHSVSSMPHAKMQEYVNVDWNQVVSIVGLIGEEGQGRIIAESRFIRIPASPYAEVVFVVDEKYQRLGIASFLYQMMIRLATERGITGFTAEVLFSNIGIMKVFRKGDFPVKAHLESGVYHLEIPFDR